MLAKPPKLLCATNGEENSFQIHTYMYKCLYKYIYITSTDNSKFDKRSQYTHIFLWV